MSKKIILSIFFIMGCFTYSAKATHVIGGDLYYEHVAGLRYKVTLVLYGDCGGTGFPTLANATPFIEVRNGITLLNSISLALVGTGVEVTPVCPQSANNTTCSDPINPIPGVSRYIYEGFITLNVKSRDWEFKFAGDHGNFSAGRTQLITNISIPRTMHLIAKLNNLDVSSNNSPTFTSVPTPFFCVNQNSSNNLGAVDPDNDSLRFSLVDALNAFGYKLGLSGAFPLDVTPGSFGFDPTSGQLDFTPNTTQVSAVVNEIKEYRNGILIGSSMREMNFIVRAGCNNTAPNGNIGNPTGGKVSVTGKKISTCEGGGNLIFSINPTDLNGDSIDVIYTGIPTGAIASVTNNNTTSPTLNFNWNLAGVSPGLYQFFVTYSDNGCPIKAKRNVAYTIEVAPNPLLDFQILSPATCFAKPVFHITPLANYGPSNIGVFQGTTRVKNHTGITSTGKTDSLVPGTYTFSITDSIGCKADTLFYLPPATSEKLEVEALIQLNDCDLNVNKGQIIIRAKGGTRPLNYKWSHDGTLRDSVIHNVPTGKYSVVVMDANGCLDTSWVKVTYDNCCKPFIPNAFTPNGDNINEKFGVQLTGDMQLIYFEVYNRFGQKIWSTLSADQFWDGTYRGKPVDVGVYTYVIKYYCGDLEDQIIQEKGEIHLMK